MAVVVFVDGGGVFRADREGLIDVRLGGLGTRGGSDSDSGGTALTRGLKMTVGVVLLWIDCPVGVLDRRVDVEPGETSDCWLVVVVDDREPVGVGLTTFTVDGELELSGIGLGTASFGWLEPSELLPVEIFLEGIAAVIGRFL